MAGAEDRSHESNVQGHVPTQRCQVVLAESSSASRRWWLQFIFTILAVSSAVTLTIITDLQRRTMDNTLKEARKQTEIADDARNDTRLANMDQQNVLQRQAVLMDSTFKTDQRAWVMPSDVERDTEDIGDGFAGAVIYFRNTGRTPALNVRVYTNWTQRREMIPALDTPSSDRISITSLAPNEQGYARVPIPLADAKRIMNGESEALIYGTVWYDDIFGRSHWAQYCYAAFPRFAGFLAYPLHHDLSDRQ